MANPDPSKTEEATEKKLQEARSDGNIAVSQDVTSVVTMLIFTLAMYLITPYFAKSFSDVFEFAFKLDTREMWGANEIRNGVVEGIMLFAKSFLLMVFILALSATLAIRIQVGSFFETKPLAWKFDSLNPASGLKQLLPNKKQIVKFLLTMCKVIVISTVAYFIIKDDIREILNMAVLPASESTLIMMQLAGKLTLYILLLFVLISIIDLIWKHKTRKEDLMMTKEEVKDERKNSDGDPKVKAKIKAKMREMALKNMASNTRQASVVITNPTHVAVALKYNEGDPAPKVVAKGLRKKALRIKEIAKQAGIPTVEAPPLARSLYRSTEIGAYIDNQFFTAVAVILAKILRKKGRSKA